MHFVKTELNSKNDQMRKDRRADYVVAAIATTPSDPHSGRPVAKEGLFQRNSSRLGRTRRSAVSLRLRRVRIGAGHPSAVRLRWCDPRSVQIPDFPELGSVSAMR